jgi:hypothetical protein
MARRHMCLTEPLSTPYRKSRSTVTWGTALTWMTGFGLLDPVAPIKAYIDRWNARPSVKKVAAIDVKLLEEQAA